MSTLPRTESTLRETLGTKLKTARSLAGLSTRGVADKLRGKLTISHATIANYESGRSTPSIDALAALASLYGRPLNWFLDPGQKLVEVRFRNLRSRVSAAELHRLQADVQRWLDGYVQLERRTERTLLEVPIEPFSEGTDYYKAASAVRRHLGLNASEPIANTISLLETYGVRTLEFTSELPLDGLSGRYGSQYVVAFNRCALSDRTRMDAASELGRLLFGTTFSETSTSDTGEKRASDFASCLLLPNSQLKKAFDGFSMVRLVQFKQRFGVSLASMIYRAEQLELIAKSVAKDLWSEFARRGWKSREPGQVRWERAIRFEELIDESLRSGNARMNELATLCATSTEAIERRLADALDSVVDQAEYVSEANVLRFPV